MTVFARSPVLIRASRLCLYFLLLVWPFACHGDADTIFRNNSGAVVVVASFDERGNPIGQGSGFIVSSDGKVVTNYHVVTMASRIKVKHGDAVYDVEGLTHVDSDNDLAILKLAKGKYPAVKIGNSDVLRVGEKVYAMGSPQGLENTISEGIVSGIRKIDKDISIIQMTAAISRGSSGGPLFNERGEVVGIATFLIAETQNLNFALPVNLITQGLAKNDLVEPGEACRVDFNQTAACFFYQGVAYGMLGRHDRAVDSFKRSLTVDSRRVETLVNLGVSYANMEKLGEAVDMFNRALALEPENVDVLARLGRVYAKQGNYAQSTKVLEKSLKINPGHVDARFFLALNYASRGKKAEAVKALQEVIRLEPLYADAYGYLGSVYTDMGRYGDAISAFKMGISQRPADPGMHLGLGKAYASAGNKASALQEYQILQTLDKEMANKLFKIIYR